MDKTAVILTGGVLGFVLARWYKERMNKGNIENHPENLEEHSFQPFPHSGTSVHRTRKHGQRLSNLSDFQASTTYHNPHDDQVLI